MPHLLPLLTIPQGMVSSTIEAFPLELSSPISLLLLPLASLALSLLLLLGLDHSDNFLRLIALHLCNSPLFILLFGFSSRFLLLSTSLGPVSTTIDLQTLGHGRRRLQISLDVGAHMSL